MTIDRVVIDASPLIVLFNSKLAELLPQLFAEIVVPGAVWNEVAAAGKTDAASWEFPTVSWVRRVEVSAIYPVIAAWGLRSGESEVLTFAWNHSGYRIIVDDAAARRCARILGMATLGTGGMLVLAKRRGLISEISSSIQAVRDAGLWLSDEVVNLQKRQAGE